MCPMHTEHNIVYQFCYCLYVVQNSNENPLTLPYGEGVLLPSAKASGGPNAHPRINR